MRSMALAGTLTCRDYAVQRDVVSIYMGVLFTDIRLQVRVAVEIPAVYERQFVIPATQLDFEHQHLLSSDILEFVLLILLLLEQAQLMSLPL